ncbi:MAG: DUF559 domain-containing protein [Candidatus Paceibacterota bacterium]
MRKNPTQAEKILWEALRDLAPSPSGMAGIRFRRQHIIGRFISDFVCLPKRLVVEVDGDIHDYQKAADEIRTEYLTNLGYTVIRFNNDRVLNDLQNVIREIESRIHPPSPSERGTGGEVVDFITIDASWTKLTLILPVVQKFLKPSGRVIALLKPHYEASQSILRKGVLKDDKVAEIVTKVSATIEAQGWKINGQTESPILGGGGNREFLILLTLKQP